MFVSEDIFENIVYKMSAILLKPQYVEGETRICSINIPDSKVHVANMEPTWVLSAPGRPHVGPINLAIRDAAIKHTLSQNISIFSFT